jgi:hypothetical protein
VCLGIRVRLHGLGMNCCLACAQGGWQGKKKEWLSSLSERYVSEDTNDTRNNALPVHHIAPHHTALRHARDTDASSHSHLHPSPSCRWTSFHSIDLFPWRIGGSKKETNRPWLCVRVSKSRGCGGRGRYVRGTLDKWARVFVCSRWDVWACWTGVGRVFSSGGVWR